MASDGEHDRYELVERIAVGGMAEVFLAKTHGSHGFEKTLAIKRILPYLASAPEFERRFIAEAKIAVTLNHANIVQVLDFSKFGESLYIAMEYVDGLDVAALLAERPELPLGAALHLAMEMLKGLDFAHRRGVVHRDVSPSNVLVSRSGEVKIADFGIAQATNAGVSVTRTRRIMGKWRYMSPEQTRGDELDARSDLFSAGAVIFEILAGKKLFAGDDAETIVRNITSMQIPNLADVRPGLPPSLDKVLRGLLHRDRASRTARAADALSALVDISYDRSVQATAMSLADVVAEVLPESKDEATQDAASACLIDDIINSEIQSGAKPGARVTMADARMPEFAEEDVPDMPTGLTFVGSGTNVHGITKWVVEPTVVKPNKARTLPLGLVGAAVDETQPPRAPETGEFEDEDSSQWQTRERVRGTEALRVPDHSYVGPPTRRWGWLAIIGGAIAIGGGVGVAMFLTTAREPSAATSADAAVTEGTLDGSRPVPVAVSVGSVPDGASIRVGQIDTNALTPAGLELMVGDEVELVLDGFEPCRLTFGGEPLSCELSPLAARLTITSDPPGASATLDGEDLGKTPIENLAVPGKSRTVAVRVELEGHKAQSRKIGLVAGEPVSLDFELVEKARFGTIDIYAEPWAHVYLRGKKIGTAPQRGLKLPIGRHRLKLTNPVQKRSTTITVSVPSSKPYRVKLPAFE